MHFISTETTQISSSQRVSFFGMMMQKTLSKINPGQYQIVKIEGLVLEFLLTGFKMFIDLIYLDHSDTSVWSPLSQTCD